MANAVSNFFKKIDKGFTTFAKSKAAVPVLVSAMGVVVVAGVAVYVTADTPIVSQATQSASSVVQVESTVVEDEPEEIYVSASIDTELYVDTVLHESEDAGEEYIADTLFLGDSNTYRYMSYGFADLTNAVGVVGMGVGGIESLDCVKFKSYSDYVTIPEALPIMQPQRVVFGFGTNNLGGSVDSFIETYTEAIQACYDAYPYFDVLVTAIPPVDKYSSYTNVSMNQINTFNAALVVMCEENGWKYINTSEVLIDEDTGYAYTEYTVSDGLHLSLEGCTALFEYIRTHAYETEDVRPKPLDEILERDETPPDLITEDPLKTSGSSSSGSTAVVETVDVYFAAATGGYISGTIDQSIAKGSTTAAVTAVPNAGYTFAGWSCSYTGLSSASDATITYTAPSDINAFGGVVVTAYFAQSSYNVSFVLAGDTAGASLDSTGATVTYGGSASANLTLQSGYTATVSGGSLSGNTVSASNVTGNTTVTITVTAPEVTSYNVYFSLAGATEGASLSRTTATVDAGGTASVTLTLADGYTASVSGGTLSGNTVSVSNVTAETGVTITVAAPTVTETPTPTVTVTFSISGDVAGVALGAGSVTVNAGDTASTSLTANGGYSVSVSGANWDGSTVSVATGSESFTVTITVTANVTTEPEPETETTPETNTTPETETTPETDTSAEST